MAFAWWHGALGTFVGAIVGVGAAAAEPAAPFYAGKTVTLVVGATPGGYYDIAGRTIALA